MSKRHRAVWILLAALAVPAWGAQPPAGLAAAFGALPKRSDVTLSPSGRMLAWLQPNGSGSEVFVYDLGAHAVRRVVRIDPGMTLSRLHWEDDDTLLMSTYTTMHLSPGWSWNWQDPFRLGRVLAVDVASGKVRVLLEDRLAGATSGYLDSGVNVFGWDIPQRPHTVIMSARQASAGAYQTTLISVLFAVDTRTGKGKPIAYGDSFTHQWVLDGDGNPVARAEWQPPRFTILARHGSGWRRIYQHTFKIEPYVARLVLDASGDEVLADLPGHDERWHLWSIPLDGSAPKRLLPTVQRSVFSFDVTRYSGRLRSVWVGRSDPRRIWIDAAAKARYESVAHAFPGREIWVSDPSRNGKQVLAWVDGSAHPPICYLVDFATHRADIAGEQYPQLAHVQLAKSHTVKYRTRDGRTVYAEVFLPAGPGKDLPLVVLPPGGPIRNDPREFDWFAQYLAARGYAVLQPDVTARYLPSFGGYILWAGASQRYLLDGVRLLVRRGEVDPHRVCVVGVGYGGYAALAAAAFFPGTYACAVSVNGISDLRSLLGYEIKVFGGTHSDYPEVAAWRDYVGSQFATKTTAESPVDSAYAVAAPVLLIHDKNDTVVPVMQSLEMKSALKRLDKPVTFRELPGNDYGLETADARVEVLRTVGRFLARYLHE